MIVASPMNKFYLCYKHDSIMSGLIVYIIDTYLDTIPERYESLKFRVHEEFDVTEEIIKNIFQHIYNNSSWDLFNEGIDIRGYVEFYKADIKCL